MTQRKAFKRAVRDRMSQTGESYSAARVKVTQKRPPVAVAITNGDSVGGTLREARLADVIIAWRDVLHDGPVPALPPARLRAVRASYMANRYGMSSSIVERELAARDASLRAHAHDDITLWFEADVHDQLQLIQILSRLGSAPHLRMISIGEHPDRARFGGLGELTPDQLRALVPQARPISTAGLELAASAWAAFTSPDPSALAALAGVVSPELRFLGDAVSRLLEEYPSRSDGLSLTQRRILLAIDRGVDTFPGVLRAHWQTEQRPFIGDLGLKAQLHALTAAEKPALQEKNGRYTLTETGHSLLAGTADWMALNGIDRWLGGVHLTGREPAWRYDERLEMLGQPAATPAVTSLRRPE